jgi:hypothetical protein
MHEVHPLLHAARGWRDFFVHIGTIAVGLLLALGLEQLVLAVHHYQQRLEIERQMDEVLHWDLKLNQDNFRQVRAFRSYLTALKDAINSRLQGGTRLPQPASGGAQTTTFIRYPNLAPYEVARQNGTAGLLSTVRLRQYARLALARDYMLTDRVSLTQAIVDLDAFQKRFIDYAGVSQMGSPSEAPDIDHLSPQELAEYRAILGRLIAWSDVVYARLDLIDLEIQALLRGARTEEELLDTAVRARPHGFGLQPAPTRSP